MSSAHLDHALFSDHRPGSEPIPGYRLLAPLGKGGFGEVWKAEAPGGLLKAIKFVQGMLHGLDDNTPADDEMRAIQRIKSVRHPFILSMERVEVVKGELVIVLELADKSLGDVLRDEMAAGKSGIARTRLLGYLREAAEALDLLNFQHQLQHLDVKPQNLFLVSNHVKVGDFGLVSSLSRHEGNGRGGAPIASTPLYAAPEVFQGVIGPHADQYSLAIVYQELLTGTLPFKARNVRQLLMAHLQTEPDLRSLPAADRPLVARALAKDPARRFPSCSDFIHALTTGQSELVAAVSPSSRSAQGVRGASGSKALEPAPDEGTSEGGMLHFCFSTTLPAHLIRLRLDGFQSQWNARVVTANAEGFVLQLQAPRSFWQRWQGPQPQVEVHLRVVPINDSSQSGIDVGAEVQLAIRPITSGGTDPAEFLGVVGPLLAESVRSHLQFNERRRTQERLVWQHPLSLRPILPDGNFGPPVECRGKDLSLGGIGFYYQGEVPSRYVMLHLPQTALTAAVAVPARIVRVQVCGDGWHEVGAVLDPPHELPAEDDYDEPLEEGLTPITTPATVRCLAPAAVPGVSPGRNWVWLIGSLAGVAAVLVGAAIGAVFRPGVAEPAPATPPPAGVVVTPPRVAPAPPQILPPLAREGIRVEGKDREFADLESAVDAAPDGGVIVLHGPRQVRPLRIVGKSLTIRGASGGRARIERAREPGRRWEALLCSDRSLVLENLHLHGGTDDLASLVCVERAPIVARNCVFVMLAQAPALALRRGERLRLERCRLEVANQALAVELPDRPCRVELRETSVHVHEPNGAMLLAWAPESAPASPMELDLIDADVQCGRILACRRVLGPVVVHARGGRLHAREKRVSFTGYGDREIDEEQVTWEDSTSPER